LQVSKSQETGSLKRPECAWRGYTAENLVLKISGDFLIEKSR
jgi:hypothetical protein